MKHPAGQIRRGPMDITARSTLRQSYDGQLEKEFVPALGVSQQVEMDPQAEAEYKQQMLRALGKAMPGVVRKVKVERIDGQVIPIVPRWVVMDGIAQSPHDAPEAGAVQATAESIRDQLRALRAEIDEQPSMAMGEACGLDRQRKAVGVLASGWGKSKAKFNTRNELDQLTLNGELLESRAICLDGLASLIGDVDVLRHDFYRVPYVKILRNEGGFSNKHFNAALDVVQSIVPPEVTLKEPTVMVYPAASRASWTEVPLHPQPVEHAPAHEDPIVLRGGGMLIPNTVPPQLFM